MNKGNSLAPGYLAGQVLSMLVSPCVLLELDHQGCIIEVHKVESKVMVMSPSVFFTGMLL
jgi:hypothetical protein